MMDGALPVVNYNSLLYAKEPFPARCLFTIGFIEEWENDKRLVIDNGKEYLTVKAENAYGVYRRDYKALAGDGVAVFKLCEASWRRPPEGVYSVTGDEELRLP